MVCQIPLCHILCGLYFSVHCNRQCLDCVFLSLIWLKMQCFSQTHLISYRGHNVYIKENALNAIHKLELKRHDWNAWKVNNSIIWCIVDGLL